MQWHSGAFVIDLAPEAGGLISRIVWTDPSGGRHDLLRRDRDPEAGDERWSAPPAAPHFFGCWPMLPFANRAFGGRIDDGETAFDVPLNHPGREHAIHGFGWQSVWQALPANDGSLRLRHGVRGAGHPYAYLAEMRVSAGDEGVVVTLSVINKAERALPYGIGFHPWFPCAADTRVTLSAPAELALDAGFRPVGQRALPDGGPYAAGALFARADAETAHSFVDWTGVAEIATPSAGLAVTLRAGETLRHPVVWAPAGADFLCIEPQSHVIGAPSEAAARAVTPLRRLEPGEMLTGWMSLTPRRI